MADELPNPVYLTRTEHDRLAGELHELETVERARLAEELRSSPPSGMGRSLMDPVRERQAFVEGRILRLRAILAKARIIDELPAGPASEVALGTSVKVSDLQDGSSTWYSIVSPEGIDAARGRISYASPVGQALLGRRPGETVQVNAPCGTLQYRIEQIERLRE